MISTLAKLIVAAVAIAAGVRVLRRTRRRLAEQAALPRDDAVPAPEVPPAPVSGPGLDRATRAQLYREAQRRGVPGRSKMTKAQLKAALSKGGRA
jgi:hypothetical protein